MYCSSLIIGPGYCIILGPTTLQLKLLYTFIDLPTLSLFGKITYPFIRANSGSQILSGRITEKRRKGEGKLKSTLVNQILHLRLFHNHINLDRSLRT